MADSSSGKGPARGYSWPPFESGHTASVRSGAGSERFLGPVVEELRVAVSSAAPWTAAGAFTPALEAWLWAEARCVLYRRFFDERGIWGEVEGEPAAGLVAYDRAEGRAAQLRKELGLTPSSLVDILGKLASHEPEAMAGALDALRAAGAQIRQAAEARQIAAAPEAGDG